MSGPGFEHEPVLARAVVEWLAPERGGLFLDGTLGGGGHAERILAASPQSRVLGFDRDPEAIEAARRRLSGYGERVEIVEEDFRNAAAWLAERLDIKSLAGALLDLGVSSHQLDTKARGFSFRRGTPLNMRMGGTTGGGRTAADFLNGASEDEIGRVFREYGEERRWRALAREIVRRRRREPFQTADDLVAAFTATLGPGLDPRTKARLFQALRIEVNDELAALDETLPRLRDQLAPHGRLVVISYHSLEDRIVKHTFREWSRACVCPPELPVCRCRGVPLGTTLTRRPIGADEAEVARNPRARSAHLRAWEKA
jgi:16S rRNA (cytosine1402-N4)-methyltransferase